MIPTTEQIKTIAELLDKIGKDLDALAYLSTNDKVTSPEQQTRLFYFSMEILGFLAEKANDPPTCVGGINSFACFTSKRLFWLMENDSTFMAKQMVMYHNTIKHKFLKK